MVRTLSESDISVICLVDLFSTCGFLSCHTSLTFTISKYCWCTRSAVPGVRFLSNKERVFTLFKTCNFVKLAPLGGPLADYLTVYLHVIFKMNHVILKLVYQHFEISDPYMQRAVKFEILKYQDIHSM